MAADIANSNLNLTSDEKRLYGQLFQQADSEKLGVVTGDVAVKFFERTKLDPVVLGEIWQLADTENRGLLTPAGFSVVLRLIGHCQAGREPSAELALRPGPLPKFDQTGVAAASAPASTMNQPPPPAPISQVVPPPAQALQQQTTGPIRVPPLTPDKVNEYSSLFDKAGAQNGLLGGDAAKQMFEKARLPNELLGRVWNLADTEQRGALGMTEFVVAMHLLASLRTGALRSLPQTLPAGLYEAAARKTPPVPAQAIPRQFTGQQAPRPQSPLARPPYVPPPMATQPISVQPLSAQVTGADWLVSPQDKAAFDKMFASIDRGNAGFIDGEQAVHFFSNSGLSEDTLATIWDLSDINSEGRLSRDEFAVAMYLIRQQRGKVDGRGSLPSTLPAGLIPPAMRKQPTMPFQPTAPAFDNATFATQQPKSASDDLFGLDAMASSPEPAPQFQAIKPSAPAPTSPQVSTTTSSPRQPVTTSFKPFTPTSSFGQGLTSQNTGGSVQSNAPNNRVAPNVQATRAAPGGLDDLLGDNDPVVSSRLTDETSELGNMSNQIGALRNQMQEVQNKKISSSTELSAASNQKRELEARLAQFRSQYEQEVREVKTLEQQLTTVRNESKRLQQDLAMLEGTQADLQTQHTQLSSAFDADQQENVGLKERVRVINESIAQLKPQLEKLRSDARQQKGLVAINKKQVATSEGERDRATEEISDLQREIAERQEQERLERERIEKEHRDTAERLRVQGEQNRAESERIKAENAQHRELSDKLKAEREHFAREKAEFERDREQKAAADRKRIERETAERQRAESEMTAAASQLQQHQQMIPSIVSSPTTGSSKNPFFKRSTGVTSPSAFSEDSNREAGHADAFESFFGPSKASTTGPPPTSFRSNAAGTSSPDRSEDREPSGLDGSLLPGSQHNEPNVSSDHRQMNSGNLPLHGLDRADSFTSSLRANPPASSFGVSGHASPHYEAGSPAESYGEESDSHMQKTSSSPISRETGETQTEQHETNSAAATGLFATIASFIPGTQSHVESTSATSAPEHHSALETIASYIPGTQANAEAKAAAETHDATDEPTSYEQASESASTSGQTTNPTTSARKDEFPPIRELDNDDDDSASDSGSDDDFDRPYPNRNARNQVAANDSVPSGVNVSHAAGKQPALEGDLDTNFGQRPVAPPPLSEQSSPPTYDQTISPGGATHDREANQFPREFDGLLPSREIVSSPPVPTEVSHSSKQSMTPNVSQFEVPTMSSFEPNHGSHSYNHSSSTSNYESARGSHDQSAVFNSTTLPIGHNTVVPQAQEPGSDDFDSAFDDLSEAREVDDPSHDSMSFSRTRTEEPEFTSEFNSPVSTSGTAMGDSFYSQGSPLPTPGNQQDGFIKVKHFTSFGAAVPSESTPYAPSSSQQSPTTSTFSSAPLASAVSGFVNSQRPVPGPPSFPGSQQPNAGPPSFSSYAPYAESPVRSPISNVGGSSGFSLGQQGVAPTQTSRQAPLQASQNDDWDELFSGLDNSNTIGSSAQQHHSNGSGVVPSSDPFAFDSFDSRPSSSQQQPVRASAPVASTMQSQVYAPPPGPPPASNQARQSHARPLSASDRYAPPSAFAPLPASAASRPQAPGRALSAGTEHDDPILKSLTGMGYKRDEALKALERYDYNIDAAIDHLSKQ